MVSYRREHAVSPVVGVMLMLAITVMIAAIASAFAGSFSDSGEKSPQSSLSVPAHFEDAGDNYRIYFDHTGGDPFSLNSIKVVFRSDETENKTQLTRQDASGVNGNCQNFTLIGPTGPANNDTTVRAGDRFFIDGKQVHVTRPGQEKDGIQFGNVIFWKDKELTWMVIDSRTSKTIAMGSIFPQ
jgi:FlaG/FlaF family flagellin (archaellin)